MRSPCSCSCGPSAAKAPARAAEPVAKAEASAAIEPARAERPDAWSAAALQAAPRSEPAALAPSAPQSQFALIPGRVPGAVSLSDTIAQVTQTDAGRQAFHGMFDRIAEKTGIHIPVPIQDFVLDCLPYIAEMVKVPVKALSSGMELLNSINQLGLAPKVPPYKEVLPDPTNLDDFASLPFTRGGDDIKPLFGGLARVSVRSDVPDEVIKRNTVMAEAFHRLAGNASAAGDKYTVQYGGRSYDSADGLVGAMRADGYDVRVTFEARIANFAALGKVDPFTGEVVDVPAPLMVSTGIKDAQGNEAVVPTSHSEMVIELRPGPNTKGPKIPAEVRWFQGKYSTGFFPADATRTPPWTGRVTHGTIEGDQAQDAVRLAAAYGEAVRQVARNDHLYIDGYAVIGVCNDSVAVVQHAVTGRYNQYPLLMQDDRILPELLRRMDATLDATYARLADSVTQLPSDMELNESTARRAFESLPWSEDEIPFYSTLQARRILAGDPALAWAA